MGSGDRSIDPFVSPPENEETSPQKWQILYIDWYWFASPSTRILAGGWSSVVSCFFLVSSVGLGQWRRVSTWVRVEAPTVHPHPTDELFEHEVPRIHSTGESKKWRPWAVWIFKKSRYGSHQRAPWGCCNRCWSKHQRQTLEGGLMESLAGEKCHGFGNESGNVTKKQKLMYKCKGTWRMPRNITGQ